MDVIGSGVEVLLPLHCQSLIQQHFEVCYKTSGRIYKNI